MSRNFKAQVAKVALVAHGRVLRLQNPQNATSYAKCPVHLGRFEASECAKRLRNMSESTTYAKSVPAPGCGVGNTGRKSTRTTVMLSPPRPAVEAKSGDKQWSNLQLNTHCHTLLTLPWLFFLGEIKTWKNTHIEAGQVQEKLQCHINVYQKCCNAHQNISKFMLSCNWLKISEAFNLPVAIRQPQPHCQAFTACSLSKVTWTTFPA